MSTLPYPLLEDVLNIARERANDMIVSTGGQTLTDNAAYTPIMCNAAWLKLQQFLASLGFSRFKDETLVFTLAPVSTLDPAQQVKLSWAGYDNGSGLVGAPAFPQNFIRPLEVWERISVNAGTNFGEFLDMDEIEDGLPDVPKQQWNGLWEWRSDALYMPGAITNVDLRIRAATYLPPFVGGVGFPGTQTANILRCEDAFAIYIDVEFATGRGDMDRDKLMAEAESAAVQLVSADGLKARTPAKASERGKMRDRYTPPGPSTMAGPAT